MSASAEKRLSDLEAAAARRPPQASDVLDWDRLDESDLRRLLDMNEKSLDWSDYGRLTVPELRELEQLLVKAGAKREGEP